jgi:hypothetical protein
MLRGLNKMTPGRDPGGKLSKVCKIKIKSEDHSIFALGCRAYFDIDPFLVDVLQER